jgi:hypothetical protein
MFIELVDALRCPNKHEESWLVASADRMEQRHIVDGALGCPVCAAEFPIRKGVVDFRRATSGSRPERSEGPALAAVQAMKLAALLLLTDAQGFAVLEGQWGAAAHELTAMVQTPLILVDPPEGISGTPGVSVIRCDEEITLASGSARGVAADTRLESAIRIVRPQGRVVARVGVDVPAGVKELARDDELWVGERDAPASPLVTLHVRRS